MPIENVCVAVPLLASVTVTLNVYGLPAALVGVPLMIADVLPVAGCESPKPGGSVLVELDELGRPGRADLE